MGTVKLSWPRRFRRVKIGDPSTAEIATVQDVRLLDIGLGGARIEHPGILHRGLICLLRLPSSLRDADVRCRVVWSRRAGRQGSTLLSESGLAFVHLSPDASATLRKLAGLDDDGESFPARKIGRKAAVVPSPDTEPAAGRGKPAGTSGNQGAIDRRRGDERRRHERRRGRDRRGPIALLGGGPEDRP